MKRKAKDISLNGPQQPQLLFVAVKKKLRSKVPRRPRRFQVSPDLQKSFDADSTAVSSVNDNSRVAKFSGDNRKAFEKRRIADVEVSETSCVDSYPAAVFVKRESKLRKGVGNQKQELEFGLSKLVCEESEVVDKSEATVEFSGIFRKIGAEKESQSETLLEVDSKDVISAHSDLTQFQKSSEEKSIRRSDHEERRSVAEHGEEVVPVEIDYTCSENFSNEDFSGECDYGYSSAFSALLSDSVPETSELELSDFAESIWDNDSGSQFSEKSNESSSPTFQLFLQFSRELCQSNFGSVSNSDSSSLIPDDDDSPEITLPGLDDKDDLESYKMIKFRERRQVYLQDYITEYCSTTDYGELIIEQRLKMVHWIYEQFQNKELQRQTMFLGVNLLDRFLSKGYFKTKRNLQIVGVACLTLARRIEENQPFNSVREKVFQLGSSTYSRSEVVAMEWLVQEVLKFKCYLPTIYDFIWFYLKATRASEKVGKTVKYMAVLALLGFEQLRFWPSTVAAGLVVLASTAEYQNTSVYPVVETNALEKDDDLPQCIESLAWLLSYIN